MAQLKATGITGSLEVINEYITGSITGSDAKFTSLTGSLQGNASTATTATTATTANAVENEITFNNSGIGDASGATYDGSSEATISYNTVGAPKSDGTGASGTWGISITGNAATVTNGVTTANISSYATTAVTAGTGLSGGGTVGALTLDLDFSELTDKTTDIAGTTEFILQDGTTESRKAASEIKLSFFNNDSGWTSNTGDITSVVAGNGLTGGATSGDATLTVGAGTGITVNTTNVAINTSVVPTLSATNTFTSRNTFSDITVDTTTLKTDGSNDAVEVGAATTTSGTPGKLRVKSAESTRTGGGLHIYNYGDSFRAWYMWQTGSTDSYKLYFGHYNQSSTPIYFDTTGSIYADGYYYGDGSKLQNLPAPSTIPITNASTENAYRYLTFVDSTSGNQSPKVDSALYYWPAQDRLFAGYFSGDGSLLTNISIGVTNTSTTNSTHYPLFASTNSSTGTAARGDSTLVYNPYYNSLSVGRTAPTTTSFGSRLEVYGGSSGGTANAFGHLCVERNGSTYMQFMATATSYEGFLFGDPGSSTAAKFEYLHSDDSFNWDISNSSGYYLWKMASSYKAIFTTDLFQLYTGVDFKVDSGTLWFDASTNRLGIFNTSTTPSFMLDVREARVSNPSGYFRNTDAGGYGLYIAAGSQDGTSKRLIRFQDNGLNSIGDITHTNGAITYGAFTGNHPAIVPDFDSTNYEYGMIVKIDSTQLLNNTQQPLFTVSKTTQAKQKSAFGVYASKDEEDNIHSIFALGDGHILVNAEGGDIEIGDYICSSNTDGIGMKQDDDLLHSYTVAKAAENVVWAEEPESIKLIICTYHSA